MTWTLPTAFQWVDDPLEGRLLFVGGAAPWIVRVLGAKGLTGWRTQDIPAVEHLFINGVLVPEIVPGLLRFWSTVAVLRVAELCAVDLLWIAYGSAYRGGGNALFYWDGHDLALCPARAARAYLADADFCRKRGLEKDAPVRGIVLRDDQ